MQLLAINGGISVASMVNYFSIIYLICVAVFIQQNSSSHLSLTPPWIQAFKYENESYAVKCNGAQNLSWKKKIDTHYIDVSDLRNNDAIIEEPGDSGLYLRFNRIQKEDKGEYVCSTKIVGTIQIKESFVLEVIKPVRFDQPEIFIEIKEGDNITLKCFADGEPEPDIIWYFRDQVVRGPIPSTIHDVYHIVNAAWDTAGTYTCQAFQNILQTRNAEKLFHVKVYHKPTVIQNDKQPITIYGFANDIVNITCEVTAEPKAYFIWYKNNSVVHPKAYKVTMINEDNKSIMQVPLDGSYRYGEYRCDATNELGYSIQTFWLNVTSRPVVPYVAIKQVFSSKVVIKVVSSKDTTFYRIQLTEHTYCSKDEKWRLSNITESPYNPEENNTIFNITGLYSNTKYVLRVASINRGGASGYSHGHLFQTWKSVSPSSSVYSCNVVHLIVSSLVFICCTRYQN